MFADTVTSEKDKSAIAFEKLVLPALKAHCPEFGDCEIRTVEGTSDGEKDDAIFYLDARAGIDAFQILPHGLKGMALRVQAGRSWETFTIRTSRPGKTRSETEFVKRLFAISKKDAGYLYPYWTIQAYITSFEKYGKLLSFAVAKTEELYPYVARGRQNGTLTEQQAFDGGQKFIALGWKEYRRSGYYLFIHRDLEVMYE